MTPEQTTALYEAIQTRPRPEDVAAVIGEVLRDDLSAHERQILDGAASRAWRQQATGWLSSMSQDFARPLTHVERQVSVAAILFQVEPLSLVDGLDSERVLAYVRTLGAAIHRTVGQPDRLETKRSRQARGLYKNARWYNKRWRILARIEQKLTRYAVAQKKYTYTRVGKSALAVDITKDHVALDANTACLMAYLSARMSLRSTFTKTSQVRAYDTIAEMLLTRCEQSRTTQWDLVARVMPDAKILAHLNETERGQLLGTWWTLLQGMAEFLETIWRQTSFDRLTMIVQRGQDSSTWNQVASGWNMARSHWISLLDALGYDEILASLCPGKVMRLMAADVAYWHQQSGDDVHPDTKVWAALPPPWEVLRGEKRCGRAEVESVCRRCGVDPATWIEARGDRAAVAFTPTPELVHGVSVSSPPLAAMLRKAGVFSGNLIHGCVPSPFEVVRDQDGFALEAREASTGAQEEQPARSPAG